jgi:hypothetical protein
MKLLMAGTAVFLVTAMAVVRAEPVTESRVWTETYTVTTSTPRLTVDNIWGNVRVRPGPDGQISVTVDETRSAPDQERFELSLQILNLDVEANESGVIFDVGGKSETWEHRRACRDCRVAYQFEIQVPAGTHIDVGTVTDGRIDVAGIAGNISASNVNGPIAVNGIRDCESLESVNGAVDVSYTLPPGQYCSI